MELPAGGLEVHHPATPHRSPPNASPTRWRRVLLCRYQPASEPLTGGAVQPWRAGAAAVPKINFLVRGQHPALAAAAVVAVAGHPGAAQGAPAYLSRLPPWEALRQLPRPARS